MIMVDFDSLLPSMSALVFKPHTPHADPTMAQDRRPERRDIVFNSVAFAGFGNDVAATGDEPDGIRVRRAKAMDRARLALAPTAS